MVDLEWVRLHSCKCTQLSMAHSEEAAAAREPGDRVARQRTECTCIALREATRQVTQIYDQALREVGLRVTQYSLLSNLERQGGLTISELAERLFMDRTTLTRNLRPLETQGLVRLAPGADRRSRAVELTDAGRDAIAAARPLWQQAERAFRRAMGRDEAADLRRLLHQAADCRAD